MMGLRIVCVIAAASVFRASLWLALAFMVGGAVLPWCAVLIANDRPARNRTAFIGYRPPSSAQQLPRQSQTGQNVGADDAPSPVQPQRTDLTTPPAANRPAVIEWLDPEHDS